MIICIFPITLFTQNRYDIVIDEIMADPSPAVGLPNAEWIELRNVSSLSINLMNWRIGDGTGMSGPMPAFILQPDSMVILCSGSSAAGLSSLGRTLAITSFPSLGNDGELIFLRSAAGKTIHAIHYSPDWYQNEVKKDGGWSLEMIDTRAPCAGIINWKASIHPSGGTPGNKNSIDGIAASLAAPQLANAFSHDSSTIILEFEEPIDSTSGSIPSNYIINGGLLISNATCISPLFNQVRLTTSVPMSINTTYSITANNILSCNNINSTDLIIQTGRPTDPGEADLIINEILFNPRPGGYDYVEIYNKSQGIFDLSRLFIANRNNSNGISDISVMGFRPFYIFPGDYVILTEDIASIGMHYLVRHPRKVQAIASLPSFPDDRGDVLLMNAQGIIIDEVSYKDDWHFKLIDDPEGVALERIDPRGQSQDAFNWHSAASTAGFGTPTYANSQFMQPGGANAIISAFPPVFSPDNDGRDDFLMVQYELDGPGYMARIVIYDAGGRPVRHLVRNALLGMKGSWQWDGLNDQLAPLRVGPYVILTEIFNLQGKKARFKNTIVLARQLD